MAHYMAELILQGRPVLVVGGGRVARRKVRSLLPCGARVTIAAPVLIDELAVWVREGRISHLPMAWSPDLLERGERPVLLFAATSDAALNRQIAALCRQQGVLCNAIDDTPDNGFRVAAMVRRGDLTIGVGTGGNSPALARLVKERIDRWLEPGWGRVVALFGDQRRRVKATLDEPRQRESFWRKSALAAEKERLFDNEEGGERWFRQRLQGFRDNGRE
ncbi:MAG: bifunctional precorrin-2 dehydrogenase/sirohydrochlorin ferrochelatase [Magnetococcales bacterium]|nr:bifunctional precorrin-2 dehydrogenase/sirohydrochlorin ferrochelatase [Magnetococcales bacterium]